MQSIFPPIKFLNEWHEETYKVKKIASIVNRKVPKPKPTLSPKMNDSIAWYQWNIAKIIAKYKKYRCEFMIMNGKLFSPLYDLIGLSTAHPAGFARRER